MQQLVLLYERSARTGFGAAKVAELERHGLLQEGAASFSALAARVAAVVAVR